MHYRSLELICLGDATTGFDCIIIPGAEKQADGVAVPGTKQRGRTPGLVTKDDETTNNTICSE